ncbi:DUF309 domain-containing protein [Candidatus Synechococcus calcipolaris G9]|uniref:DUF309 domain-containing protein n=1 Tax=Candidatus Synechococcus calcipolaris G9 TaxID=1497997 RepID=A0ABT6F0L9_9SYNE|nr:DUF309 domain-containing protein [Candidatus Synechococcus calcipolaris]MDG2991405.1 DUF309 domain-containing protein [Candidatus Synechococcus calcipolaris G9]
MVVLTPDHFPDAFWRAIAQFNQKDYYACHDTLEDLWMEAIEPERSFYQGLLQLAVACYHLSQGNRRGAILLLGEGMKRLKPYGADYAHLNIAQLRQQAQSLQRELQQSGEVLPLPDLSISKNDL